MNYVKEVLSSSQTIELEKVKKDIPTVIMKISDCHYDLQNYVEDVYTKFTECPDRNKSLLKEGEQSINQLNELKITVEESTKKQLSEANKDIQRVQEELNETEEILKVMKTLTKVHKGLRDIKVYQNNSQYVNVINEIINLQTIIDLLPREGDFKILNSFYTSLIMEKEIFYNKVFNVVGDNIILKNNENENAFITSIEIKHFNDDMKQALHSLEIYNPSIMQLNDTTRFIWDHIFIPIVDNQTVIGIETGDYYNTLTITIKKIKEKPSYKEVFNKLTTVVNFLSINLNYTLMNDSKVLSYIGHDLRDNLSELIIKRCLEDTIPSTAEELKEYNEVIKDTENLMKILIKAGIFADDSTSLLDYANNVNVLFINKQCRNYITIAETLMKKDLHDMVEVGVPHDFNKPLSGFVESDFPHCSVSCSCINLIELCEKILDQCVASSDVCAGRLYCTVQNILTMYGKVVTEHHHKLLLTIPQQVALFHNNCLYIANNIQKFNDKYQNRLPAIIKTEIPIFKEQENLLSVLGNTSLDNYIAFQVKQIEENMNESGLKSIETSDALEPSVEKCIRQCLRQQELLKTVWQKVLPYDTYSNTFGYFLSILCSNLIDPVLEAEDISSTVAEQLVDTYKIVITRGPKLFVDPKEISLYVDNWSKLNEIVFILNSGLIDISERWAEGKGPLTLHFKAEEVKKLIKALFQNTDMRANVLSKIM